MSDHLSECLIASYLVGDIDELGARRLEHHVGECSACAARLQHEAAFEVMLYEAADTLDVVEMPKRRRWDRIGVAISAFASMAAALVLGVSDPQRWIDVHQGQADAPESALRAAAILGDDLTLASDLGTCFPPVDDDAEDCDDLVALATFPDDESQAFEPFAPRAPMCEDDEDSGPICLDG